MWRGRASGGKRADSDFVLSKFTVLHLFPTLTASVLSLRMVLPYGSTVFTGPVQKT